MGTFSRSISQVNLSLNMQSFVMSVGQSVKSVSRSPVRLSSCQSCRPFAQSVNRRVIQSIGQFRLSLSHSGQSLRQASGQPNRHSIRHSLGKSTRTACLRSLRCSSGEISTLRSWVRVPPCKPNQPPMSLAARPRAGALFNPQGGSMGFWSPFRR